MNSKIKALVSIFAITGVAVGVLAFIYKAPDKPLSLKFIEDKLKSITMPKAQIGSLAPTRDLKGAWKSPLSNKGIELFGRFVAGDSVTTIHENGDLELIVESVENNVAYGKMRYTNLCVTTMTTAPQIKPINLRSCFEDSGYLPVTITISASAVDFGTVVVDGASTTMRGSYTTDIMNGAMTAVVPNSGEIKGRFFLVREK